MLKKTMYRLSLRSKVDSKEYFSVSKEDVPT